MAERPASIEGLEDLLFSVAGFDGLAFVTDDQTGLIWLRVGSYGQSISDADLLDITSRAGPGGPWTPANPMPSRPTVSTFRDMAIVRSPPGQRLTLWAILPADQVPRAIGLFEQARHILAVAERVADGSGGEPGHGADALAGVAAYLPRVWKKFPVN